MKPQRRTGDEPFIGHSDPQSFTLKDFWAWSSSDVLGNRMRGIVAEFIVAQALGVANNAFRVEWDECDVYTPERKRIEVKSSAYCQAWDQEQLSKITFSIRPARSYDYGAKKYSVQAQRNSDLYVFALLHVQDKELVNVLDLSQWSFYVVPTERIVAQHESTKSLSLKTVEKLAVKAVTYDQLKVTIDGCLKALGLR